MKRDLTHQPKNYISSWIIISLSLLAGFIDLNLIMAYARGTITLSFWLLCHLMLILLLIIWWFVNRKKQNSYFFPLLMVVMIAIMGPLGAAGVILAIVANNIFMRNALPFEEWYHTLFPAETVSRVDQLYQELIQKDVKIEQLENVSPFMDIINYGNYEQKLALIVLIVKRFRASFSPLLKLALQDESNPIRVMAASAMSIIENNFTEKAMQLLQQLEKNREPEVILSSAELYDDYAFTGLLSETQEYNNQEKALHYYQEYLKHFPDDMKTIISIGRLHVRMGHYQRAIEWFSPFSNNANLTPSYFLWYMEGLYECKDFIQIRNILSRYNNIYANEEFLPDMLKQSIQLWERLGEAA